MQELIEQFSQEQIEPLSRGLREASALRREIGTVSLQWPADIMDYERGERQDPVITELRQRRKDFGPLFADFHNEVFLGAKRDIGAIYIPAGRITDDSVRTLQAERRITLAGQGKSLLSTRYQERRHGKLLTDGIVYPMPFMRTLDLTAEQSYRLVTAPDGAIAVHTLYAPWEEIVADVDTSDMPDTDKNAYKEHLENIQMAGISNLIAMLAAKDTPKDADGLLRLMNAAYSLDNPSDPFSRRAYEDPVVQHETEFDWRVIRRAILLFGKEELFQEALSEGEAMFGGPAEPLSYKLDARRESFVARYPDKHSVFGLAQMLEDRNPEFVTALSIPSDGADPEPAQAFWQGRQAGMQYMKTGQVKFFERRPIVDITESTSEELEATYCPEIHTMLQEWMQPVLSHYQTLFQTYSGEAPAEQAWQNIRRIQGGGMLPPEDLSTLPLSAQESYKRWARRLVDRFPVNYDVSVATVAQHLHATVGLELFLETRQIDDNLISQWTELCTKEYDDLTDDLKQRSQRVARELLTILPVISKV